MKVYAVACWDHYYPSKDNVQKVFFNEDSAYNYLEALREREMGERGAYKWDNYDVFEYDVEE